MARQSPSPALAARVLVVMQLLRTAFAFSMAPSRLKAATLRGTQLHVDGQAQAKSSSATDGISAQAEYVLMADGQATCASGLQITSQQECQVAYASIEAANSLSNKRGMQRGSWNGVPVDCSIQYNNPNYDQAPHWNTLKSTDSSRVASGEFRMLCRKAEPEYVLMSQGQTTCAPDLKIRSKRECDAAYASIQAENKMSNKRGMQKGSWNGVPLDCSTQYDSAKKYGRAKFDQAPHWNTRPSTDNSRVKSGEFRIICLAKTAAEAAAGEMEMQPNAEILAIEKKIDDLSLQCKVSKLKDKEAIESLQSQLQKVSGELASNLAQQSAAQTGAEQDKAQTVKLKGQLASTTAMCQTQEKTLNATAEMLLRDQGKADGLRALSSKCGSAVLTAIHASTSVAESTLPSPSFLQNCDEEAIAPMLAAGKTLELKARELETPFAREAFREALHRASISEFTALIANDRSWPSKSKPPSKAKAKTANACKLAKGSVNCGKLKAELDSLAKRLEEQKEAAMTNQRKGVQDCLNKVKQVNDRMKVSDSQYARSSAELVRLTGVKTGLASSRASIVTRLERTKRDAKKFGSTCSAGVDKYQGELDDIHRKRQKAADKVAGKKVAIQDCKVTEWVFKKCSKPCKQHEDDAAGEMEGTREVAQLAGEGGASCPVLATKLPCNDKPCPINCVVGGWAKWSACSKDCGGGTTSRARKVITQAKDGGKLCPVTEERKSCNVGSCSDECKLHEWTPWSTCSRRCKFSKNSAAGRQRRIREVQGDPVARGGSSSCPAKNDESRLQTRSCNQEICPKGITCDASQDVLFLLDASGEAGAADVFKHQLDLVAAVAETSSEKVKIGALAYGKKAAIISRITADRMQLAVLDYTPPEGGSRNVAPGEVLGQTMFSDPGVGGGRPKIAVLLLGGAPSGFAEARKAAKALRAGGVRIVVGLIDDGSQLARDQACSLASKPCSANVEAVQSWEQMAEEPGRFLAGICRDLVYPGPKVSPMDKMAGKLKDDAEEEEMPEMGDYGPEQMPEWMKKELGVK